MWKQWSRALWLHKEDKNTHYFHCCATHHRFRRNKIDKLEDAEGAICSDEKGIATILVNYYQQLFTTSNLSMIDAALDEIPAFIDAEMNGLLSIEFTRDEVESALKQMEPLKAQEPDKLPLLFFQKYWPNIGDEFSLAILSCLNSGSIPPSINHTYS